MSTTAPGAPGTLDIQEQVARIERAQEETRRFVAEQHKLIAEAAELERAPRLAPIIVISGTIAALIAAGIGALGKLLH